MQQPLEILYTVKTMKEHLIHGHTITDEQIQAWADEAEAGYDLSQLPSPKMGPPESMNNSSTVISVELDDDLVGRLAKRAAVEGLSSQSEAIRRAIHEWVEGPNVA